MAIHTIFAAAFWNGTMNISTLAMLRVRAESNTQGRALPARARVRSMSWPTTRFAATIKMVENSWRAVRKPRSSLSTSVK